MVLAAHKNSVDVILLQEAFDGKEDGALRPAKLETKLQETTGAEWAVVRSGFPVNLITCYRKEKYAHSHNETSGDGEQAKRLTLKLGLRSGKQSSAVMVHNLHVKYDAIPTMAEDYCRGLLEKDTQNFSIIAGDLNTRIAPEDTNPRNIATSVIPLQLVGVDSPTSDMPQQRDFPDGVFSRAGKKGMVRLFCCAGKVTIIKHAITVLDFLTGEPFESGNLPIIEKPAGEEFLRPVMSLLQSEREERVLGERVTFKNPKI